jgi:hypothetical protein
MRDWTPERWTGTAGIVTTVVQVIAFGAFFAAGSPTGLDNANGIVHFLRNGSAAIQTSVLLFFLAFGLLFVFLAGFRAMIAGANPKFEYLGTAAFGLGATGTILGFVSLGILGAAVANAGGTPDVPAVHAMFVASGVIGGAPSAVALAFFLGVSGSALSKSAILPRWTVWLSWVAAILILITAPALYGGDNASAFYTANGIVTLLALLPLYVWTLAVSIAILRKAP